MSVMAIRNVFVPRKRKGFSLPELSITILCMMVLATILYLAYDKIQESARRSTTMRDMETLQSAVLMYSTAHISGSLPADLGALVSGLTAAQTVDGIARTAFVRKSGWTSDASTCVDAWGNAYVYNASTRTITSTANGGAAITVSF